MEQRRKKGYLKIHVAVDIQTKKILSMEVTDEHVHDSKILRDLVDEVLKINGDLVCQLLADGVYDLIILLDTYQRMGLHHV